LAHFLKLLLEHRLQFLCLFRRQFEPRLKLLETFRTWAARSSDAAGACGAAARHAAKTDNTTAFRAF
jgi:hypothetical protein